ncbi:MAG: exodeoxyribonuclease VII small subunit [Lachnospiraceae bacterium]|nr:exodeoxyribonuclease VII small subunit [Lachnospiraceae bacterium]
MSEQKNTFTLEENFSRLEEIIEKMEADDISLEEAFAAYSTGMAVLKECNEQIDRVEKKVLKLSEQGVLEEF